MTKFRESFALGDVLVSISGEKTLKASWIHRVQPVLADLHASQSFLNFIDDSSGESRSSLNQGTQIPAAGTPKSSHGSGLQIEADPVSGVSSSVAGGTEW